MLLAVLALATAAPTAARNATGSGPAAHLYLNSGVAVASDDVWLVGSNYPGATQTVARHWNGSIWSSEPTPNPGTEFNFLSDVDASASNDVWAVGAYSSPVSSRSSLVEHWDGESWSVVPVPNPSGDDQLIAVSVVDRHDVWAAGWTFQPLQGFLLHWNGHRWTTEGVRGGQYFDLSATSDHDVWTTYEAHPSKWDGSSWTDKYLSMGTTAIEAIGPKDVWAAGGVAWSHSSRNAFAHFDGIEWTQTVIDSPGHGNHIRSLSAVTSNDVWAVGTGIKERAQVGQVLHWDGNAWSAVLRRTPPGNGLYGVVASGPHDAWAFGFFSGTGPPTNAWHWDGRHWKRYAVQ